MLYKEEKTRVYLNSKFVKKVDEKQGKVTRRGSLQRIRSASSLIVRKDKWSLRRGPPCQSGRTMTRKCK